AFRLARKDVSANVTLSYERSQIVRCGMDVDVPIKLDKFFVRYRRSVVPCGYYRFTSSRCAFYVFKVEYDRAANNGVVGMDMCGMVTARLCAIQLNHHEHTVVRLFGKRNVAANTGVRHGV